MKIKDLTESNTMIVEGKIPEYVMDKIELAFSNNRGKFSSASQKFIAVRDMLAKRQTDSQTSKHISNVTPAMFFQYKKGERYMIEPEESIQPKQDTTPKRSRKDIPYTVDATGNFKALPAEVSEDHTIPEILSYYMNTYYNSMPLKELAKNVAFNHFQHHDDISGDDVEKMLLNAEMDSSIKRRLDDETVIKKSIDHFGFKSDDELKQAIQTTHKDLFQEVKDSIRGDISSRPPLPYGDKQYNADLRKGQNTKRLIDETKMKLVDAYLKRDAKLLDHYTKKLQIIEYVRK